MPRKAGKVPNYCLHKKSGQAVVRIRGKDRYLGKYGSPESRERTEAREIEPVGPVPDLHVAVVLPFLPPQIAATVKVQRLTGMRPSEVIIMRPCDIDTNQTVWLYEPRVHKNRWRGKRKLVPLRPEAQRILGPCMKRE